MIRPSLDAIRASIRLRLQQGEEMDWLTVWRAAPDASRTWAHDTLRILHRAGAIHIARWKRGMQGPACPVYLWGQGVDAERPKKLTSAQKCKAWRRRNPEKVQQANKRHTFLYGKKPLLDPIHAALLGIPARGNARTTSQ